MNGENLKATDIIFMSFIAFLFLGLILFIPLNIIFFGGFIFAFYLSWVLFFVTCPILLVFQIMEKEKTTLNKILLVINSIIVSLVVISLIISSMTAFLVHNFVNNFDNFGNFDKFMNQIRIEEPKFEHKNPIVKYIDEYKKQNNEYPKTLDEKVIKSRKIENIEYKPSKDGYKLEIKYKNGKKEELEHFENAQTEKNGNSYHYSFSFKSDND